MIPSADNIKVSVILPTYNEKDNINNCIHKLCFQLSRRITELFEIIVVDDDSEDKTWQIVQGEFCHDRRIKIIRRIGKKGLASAIQKGIKESSGDIVCWMDCDFSMPPYKLISLIKRASDSCDICVGSRFMEGSKDLRLLSNARILAILSKSINLILSAILGNDFKDYTSGFVAAKKHVFSNISIEGDYGEYFIHFIYSAFNNGYKIIEVPYFCMPRRSGISKTGGNVFDYFKKGWKYIVMAFYLKTAQHEYKRQ